MAGWKLQGYHITTNVIYTIDGEDLVVHFKVHQPDNQYADWLNIVATARKTDCDSGIAGLIPLKVLSHHVYNNMFLQSKAWDKNRRRFSDLENFPRW